MGLLKQAAVAVIVLLVAVGAFLRLSPETGRQLLAEDSVLPASLRPAIAAIVPAGSADSRVGATRSGPGQRTAPLVVVDPARTETTRDRLRAVGTGEAARSVAVYPDAAGIVTQIRFAPGDEVAEGAVLANLQSDAEVLALDRARIALEAAVGQVERFRALQSSAAVTGVQIDEAARAQRTAELDLRAAEIALERRDILAPISGRVGLSAVDTGTLVGNQTLIATIDDRERLKIVFQAPESLVPELAPGLSVRATPTTRTGRSYEGEIAALDSRIDEASRTLRVEALVDNSGDELRPGMSFSIELDFTGEDFLSVDPLSVQWERVGAFVWVIEDDAARKAPISIVERNVDRILVASDDLAEGDAVVVEGIQSLREGITVRLAPSQADAPAEEEGEPIAATPGAEGPAPDRRAARAGSALAAEVSR